MLLFGFSISFDAEQAQTNKRNVFITKKTFLSALIKKNQTSLLKFLRCSIL